MFFKPTAIINLTNLKYNYNQLKTIIDPLPVMIMVKADAYGHGMLEVARTLDSADFFGVARLSEAIDLIGENIKNKIVLMEGFFDMHEFKYCIQHSLDFVIHQHWQVELILSNSSYESNSNIWIKVNTGMNRLGFLPEEINSIYIKLIRAGWRNIKFITHFSDADSSYSRITEGQNSCFKNMLGKLDGDFDISIANSAALINYPFTRQGIVRTGIAIYGISPSLKNSFKLKPVMAFYSKIIAINNCEAYSGVGYSGTWESDHPTRLAVIAVGYGDGYPRHAKNGTPLFIKGKRYPLAGRVSMDMVVVDIGTDEINLGDSVELWGNNISINEVADYSDTISYELMCGLTKRVRKVYE